MERRLGAILAADAVGYSKLMGLDEEAALAALSERRSVIEELVETHGGRTFGSAGDSLIAEFPSSVEAARCALELQDRLHQLDAALPDERRMRFRIGVSFGDVMHEGGDAFGDAVNVAARLESLAPPGGICVSGQVAEQLSGALGAAFANAGVHRLKHIARPTEVWCWPSENARGMRRAATAPKRRLMLGAVTGAILVAGVAFFVLEPTPQSTVPSGPRIAVLPFENLGVDADQAYFSSGLTKDINAYLSKFSNLFVIAPSSVDGFQDDADCGQIRRELRADYILGGTVRRSRDHLRVTTTFTDAKTCRQLDAPGPFDRDLSADDVLDIQLEIAKKVVAAIGSEPVNLSRRLRRCGKVAALGDKMW